jgi:hypothetical protein
MLLNPTVSDRAAEYAAKLLPISKAQKAFGFSESTFLRFRNHHRIPILPGQRLHIDDIIAALERERKRPS